MGSVTSQAVADDLVRLAAGRRDLSTNPADHDPWCARTEITDATCTCTASPAYEASS